VKVEGRWPGRVDDSGDPRDLIVGTMHRPAWLGRVPALAWVFVGLAALDGAFRTWDQTQSFEMSGTDIASLLESVVIGAAAMLLPAAMIVGRRGNGRAGSWLLQGGIALAAAELVRLFGRDVLNALAGPPSNDGAIALEIVLRGAAIQVPLVALQVAGLVQIGLGLLALAAPGRPLGRIVFTAVAAALVLMLVDDLLTIQAFASESAPDTLLLAYDVLGLVAGMAVLALWAWIASIGARRTGRTWRLVTAGALAVGLASGIRAFGDLVGITQALTDNALTVLIWFGLAASAAGAVGASVLLVAFGSGVARADGPAGA
jgi:hypothetical protein